MKHFNKYFMGLSLCFVILAGCSSDKRVPISGTITMNGEPLALAAVEFIPEDQTILNTRTGANTKEDGSFSIPKSRGLEPGVYVVTIYAAIDYDRTTRERATVETSPTQIVSKVLTPPEYSEKSTLRFTVNAKGQNVYTCDVKSNVSRDFGPN